MLLEKETINKFGYNPCDLKKMSGKRVIYSCRDCGVSVETQMSSYTKSQKICKSCSQKRVHRDVNSKYNTQEYRNIRSEIATKSNRSRKKSSKKFERYLPYLDKVARGEISFLEIGQELGLDDSTVCRFFHSNFNLKSKINYSVQEREAGEILERVFGSLEYQKRYNGETKNKSDFYSENIGHIEYDGNGFFHIKKSDNEVDLKYKPIRLNAQIIFGKEDYVNFKLLNKNTGYCSVKTPKEYQVREVKNRKLSTKMLENCHILGNCAGSIVFGLYYLNTLIGVAKFGNPTNRADNGFLELRRFFVLDGTPKNTESFFLRQCEKKLNKNLVTYIHAHEVGSYLKALGWKQHEQKQLIYDIYIVDGKIINKRRMWGWAKKIGLVDKFGTTEGKEVLAKLLGATKILEPSKIKFSKELT